MAKEIAGLNDITVRNSFDVLIHSRVMDAWIKVSACGTARNGVKFSAHVYAAQNCQQSLHLQVQTLSTDGLGPVRTCATGRTLDELAYNLDWPHKPSEMALLRQLLSTRQQTNDNEIIGDAVFRQLSHEEAHETRKRLFAGQEPRLTEETDTLNESFAKQLAEARARAEEAARFGLSVPVKLSPQA